MTGRCLAALWVWLSWTALAQGQEVNSWVHTRDVTSLIIHDGALWVGSTGGVERYELAPLTRTHHLTTANGLTGLSVLSLKVRDGKLLARTPPALCRISAQQAQCEPTNEPLPMVSGSMGMFQGALVSAELSIGARVITGTRGQGAWLRDGKVTQRLTPEAQICSNHVQAMASYRGELWLGGFRDGLCVRRGQGFVTMSTPFHFVNALHSVDDVLYVAANEGLFRSRDGVSFERVLEVNERGANGLASDPRTLWVTTPSAVYALPRARGQVHVLRVPGGSTAIQGVAVRGGEVWLATEDRGALRLRPREHEHEEVTVFDALSGLDSSWVLDVAIDDKGTTYAATLRHGLFAIDQHDKVSKQPLRSSWLLRLAIVRHKLWVGTQDGLIAAAGEHVPPALSGLCVHSVLDTGTSIWAGTESGAFEW